ncbi:MAG: translocation/assembly module TamB domain-containing protein [Bacteroidota bacterium]
MSKTETDTQKPKQVKRHRWLRRLLRTALGVLIFLFLVVLFIRSSWGQNIIVNRIVDYASNKTKTKINIERLFITFDGDVQLDGLYLEDKKGDTLIYSKSLEANIPLWHMINGNAIGVDGLDWEGLRANITRNDTVSGFNFQFLIDAFAETDTTSTKRDTTSNPLNLVIGNLDFMDFDIVYNDAVTGVNSRFRIGNLEADMETVDIQRMNFEASEINLKNSDIKLIQTKSTTNATSTSETPLPKFSVETISLEKVVAYYESRPAELVADVDIAYFKTEIPQLDLECQIININNFDLSDSKIAIFADTQNANTESTQTKEQEKSSSKGFEWPPFQIEVASIQLKNNDFDYRVGNAKLVDGVFNPNAIAINNLQLDAETIFLKNQTAGITLNQLDFVEYSKFNLDRLTFKLNISNKELSLENLDLQLNDNRLQGYAQLNYKSLTQLIDKPENTKVNLNFPNFRLSLKEAFKFQPQLEENPTLSALSENTFYGNINASGTLANVNIPNLNLNLGDATNISTNATLQNVTTPENLQFNVPNISAETSRPDLVSFIDTTGMGLTFPKEIRLAGSAKGSIKNISASMQLTTSQGNAEINGTFKNQELIAYDTELKIDSYKVNELVNNPQLGALSLELKSQGKGTTINSMDATLDATIEKFELNNYTINDLNIKGTLENGSGRVLSDYKDDNLNMNLDAFVVLDSIAPEATAEIDIIGANLQALGVMRRDVRTGMKIFADFKGNAKKYDVSAIVDDGVVVYDNRTYLLGSLDAMAHVRPDTTSVSVRNKMVDLNLKSNTDPQTFSTVIRKHIRSYFYRDSIRVDTITKPVNLKLKGRIAQSPLLNEVLLVNAKDIDTITVDVDFNEKARKLDASIAAPHINYAGNEIDSLLFTMETDKEDFNFNLGFSNITAGPLDVPKTVIYGKQSDDKLDLDFRGIHNDSLLMHVNTEISGNRERLVLKVNPDSLILNKHQWKIPKDNEIVLTDNNLEFNQFKISKDNQTFEITDKLSSIERQHVALDFENFKIGEVFNYLNPEAKLATGNLNGQLILEEPFGEMGIVADLAVSKLRIVKTEFGTLNIDAKSLGGSKYDFKANLAGGDVDLNLNGDYVARSNDAELNLDLDITEFRMKALNTLSLGEIKNSEGSFNGAFKVTGSVKDPQYNGQLNFNNATFNVSKLNAPFTLKNETLNVDNSGLTMNNFTVLDSKNNALVLSGKIGTKSFVNPTFDLSVEATDFHILDSTKEDNELFYGVASFDADARLTGDLQIPKLDADLTLSSDTDFTYVLPSSVANIEERDGVVVFVNRENPDAILTKTEQVTATVTGFDISTLIKVGNKAKATIIIDENTGDNFQVEGKGELDLKMAPNGRITLSGVYEISDGHYELTLYNIVNRKFDIAPGSRVTWSGDPFDAKLDVSAIYRVETSASSLMAPSTSNLSTSERGRYRQELPFLVYLNIDGELMQPEISFKLDMPEDEQGAVGGQVYGRVQQVNQQENELNRQVFSLLTLNRFYPDPGSDGSQGGIASVARDNLNDAVASQLNAFSDKLLGDAGIELDFGLDSYTDYQGSTPTDRTQLEVAAQKKLFNDRLTVRVGSDVDIQGSDPSGQTAPLIGNVSLEYMLTENGRYRLKGFRKSEFENVVEGQTIVSGIALIFTKEFNEFHELWDALLRSQSKDEEDSQSAESTQSTEKSKEETKSNYN